ncbi:MAG TPA: protein-disulfide reductase DsbD domain-containing protein [Allosphingosinicella sp.]|jgi:thiol:disulfide interchange protein
MIRSLFLTLWLLLAFASPAGAQFLAPGEKAMRVELVAEGPAPAAGGKVALALRMTPRPGWHGYWKNPGDAGFESSVEWRLPKGAAAAPLRYPVPKRLIVAGLMNYVFEGEHALLTELTVPSGLGSGNVLPVRATLDYLVCTDEICVRETADLALDLPVGAGADRRADFNRWREALPRPLGSAARFERTGGKLRLLIPLPATAPVTDPYFFPLSEGVLDHSASQSVTRTGDALILETKAAEASDGPVEGVIALGDGRGLSLRAEPGPVPPPGEPLGGAASAPEQGWAAIAFALGGAVLGGLLLNIMPCVFPILSLKALSLARAGGDERSARREAIAYTAGVVGICLALGAALLALRAGGSAVGWAFQLQEPRVILLLLLLVTAIALNLAGLFELPSLGGGGRLAGRGGTAGAFWTGALAAFVATPCTGPFMGAALGAALVLPEAAALAIFAGLGLGLALPFLLLGFVPALRRRLPKPGAWMGRLRRILSVPMFLTALALAWILERQIGGAGLLVGLAAALAVAVALWWAGRRHAWLPLAPAALASAAALAFIPTGVESAEAHPGGTLAAEPFSEARLATLRAANRPVFLYFTADWCVTCKVNEKAVLERAEVARAFKARGVQVLVGDWTRGDGEIGRFLEKHGRSGVPLYLWYAPGREAEVLPQILTVSRITGFTG